MDLSRILNHDSPVSPIDHHLISPSYRQVLLESLINDPYLTYVYRGALPNEEDYSGKLGEKLAQLLNGRSHDSVQLELKRQIDLRMLKRVKTSYEDTLSVGRYRQALQAMARSSFTRSMSSPSRGTGLAGGSEKQFGPCKCDVIFLGSQAFVPIRTRPSEDEAVTLAANGPIEIKDIPTTKLHNTCLAMPYHEITRRPLRSLSAESKWTIRRGMAQAMWYGLILQEMAVENGDATPLADFPPVLVCFYVSGWFVRMFFRGGTIFVERPEDTPLGSGAAGGGQEEVPRLEDYVDLIKFLDVFQQGHHFPHHVSNERGARALFEYIYAAANLVRLEVGRQTALHPTTTLADAAVATVAHDLKPPLTCFNPTHRPPPLVLPASKDNVLRAGLESETGIGAVQAIYRAESKATKASQSPAGEAGVRFPTTPSTASSSGRQDLFPTSRVPPTGFGGEPQMSGQGIGAGSGRTGGWYAGGDGASQGQTRSGAVLVVEDDGTEGSDGRTDETCECDTWIFSWGHTPGRMS